MQASLNSDRSGRYEHQASGYRAFIPAPLPPSPPIEMTDALHTALSRADRALGRLDGSIETLPHPDLFLSMFVRREAALSSQIEGTQASLSDVIQAEAGIRDQARPSDVTEVRNYITAMSRGIELLETLPISTRLISELHRTLMQDVRGQHQQPGEIRTSQNWIGAAGCSLRDALFVPPPPQQVHAALGALERFIHDDQPLPVLIRAGLIHAQFETIHPFLDGNGRIGRLLITLFLVEQTVLSRPVLYLSLYLKTHRAEYYDRLQAVRDRGAWEGWLAFFLEGVATTANLAAETAKRVLRLREDDRDKIVSGFTRSSSVPLRVLDGLYRLPVVTPQMIAERWGVSYPTANMILQQLVAMGIVSEVTGRKRDRAFVHTTYQALFDDL